MTPDEQRIAIAEACPTIFRHDGRVVYYRFDHQRAGQAVDPLNDLNAMHEAEATLPDGDADGSYSHYAEELDKVTEALTYDRDGWATHHWRRSYSATAAQRAEALCHVMWPERWNTSP